MSDPNLGAATGLNVGGAPGSFLEPAMRLDTPRDFTGRSSDAPEPGDAFAPAMSVLVLTGLTGCRSDDALPVELLPGAEPFAAIRLCTFTERTGAKKADIS
mmetsp:Transcript_137900/g.239739  ORF Transcript_137900/g.239739 Transcript_137900/m.239739 type:complete len:101 (-) Transcript_137900:82-384(-)